MASSIPLPALAIQPPRQTDMAQNLSQMVNLANAMKQAQFQAQMQPLQLQQQAVQLQASNCVTSRLRTAGVPIARA